MRMGRRERVGIGLLYVNDLVLSGESEENLRAIVGSFVGAYEKTSEIQCR